MALSRENYLFYTLGKVISGDQFLAVHFNDHGAAPSTLDEERGRRRMSTVVQGQIYLDPVRTMAGLK
jgi:hypothetical protein